MNEEIVIDGGNFCPITMAHVIIAEHIRDALNGRVYVVADDTPNHRAIILDGDARHAMIVKALAGRTGLIPYRSHNKLHAVVDEIELLHPGQRLNLVVGPDYINPQAAWYLPRWQMATEMMSKCRIITHPRGGGLADFAQVKEWAGQLQNAEILVVDCPLLDISSTMVRESAAQGKPLTGLVPDIIIPDIQHHFGPKH